MSRLKADTLLLLVAFIWGLAFVAQKDAMQHVGAFTFVAARFIISALVVLPLAWREQRNAVTPDTRIDSSLLADFTVLCLAFAAGVFLQQAGIVRTTVTNAGFLTGLYVLFVPLICRLVYRQKFSVFVIPGALLSVAGVWLLSGGLSAGGLNLGDVLVLGCAAGFALQVTLVGRIVRKVKAPMRICFIQYAAMAIFAGVAALVFETPTVEGVKAAGYAILYAGALSGGIAYTLQVVAQQYTPSSDSAVILSAESVFAALAAALMMHERLTTAGALGCTLIVAAILLVEFGPFLKKEPVNAA